MARRKLGEILMEQGLITEAQLQEALKRQEATKGQLGEVLIKMNAIAEEDLAAALGSQLLIPFASKGSDLLTPDVDDSVKNAIPYEFAKSNLILPLSKTGDMLKCAVFNPFDLIVLDNLKKMTGCEVSLVIATKTDLLKAIHDFYMSGSGGRTGLLGQAVEKTYVQEDSPGGGVQEQGGGDAELSMDNLIAKAEEAPVIKLVDLIIRQAIDERASDIHIEPFKDKIEVRYRIDGKLYQIPPPARHLLLPIISRIKILAKLDIAEKRMPQDGRISAKLENRTVDLRVSTLPTVWGEKVVMRILDKQATKLELSTLGFSNKQLSDMRKALKTPYGLFFVTGPTGSGKSTTLYSSLAEVLDPTKNIMTAEDPVEFRIEGINQVQVKADIGLTFAKALRAFLRQDPDIIMVGEVRDLETAEICVKAALTGHFVLSTLHTNDAASAITRLIDIGVPGYLLTPSLVMVVAQRLARKLCHCKEAYEPSEQGRKEFKLESDLIYRAKGCDECNQTGYAGRLVVAEVLMIDDDIRQLMTDEAPYIKIRDEARKNGMLTLSESGFKKVDEGETSLEEVLGVTAGY